MERVPQVLVSETMRSRLPLEEMPRLQKGMQRVERTLGAEGRLLVRWSGTEPKLRVMIEGPDERALEAFAHELVALARKDVG